MTALFSPTSGIGLDFLRNPMGASDLARSNYTYDDGSRRPEPQPVLDQPRPRRRRCR